MTDMMGVIMVLSGSLYCVSVGYLGLWLAAMAYDCKQLMMIYVIIVLYCFARDTNY